MLIWIGRRFPSDLSIVYNFNPEEKMIAKDEMFQKWIPVTEREVSPQNAILEEQKEFVQCIRDEAFPSVSGRDGLAAVEIAERILQSIDLDLGESKAAA